MRTQMELNAIAATLRETLRQMTSLTEKISSRLEVGGLACEVNLLPSGQLVGSLIEQVNVISELTTEGLLKLDAVLDVIQPNWELGQVASSLGRQWMKGGFGSTELECSAKIVQSH